MSNTGTTAGGSWTTAAHRTPDTGSGPGDACPCDLVTVPARQGLEAVDILRLRDDVGPVLHDGTGDTLSFLVPPGTADAWDMPGSSCVRARHSGRPEGPELVPDPAVGAADPPVPGAGWLVPPRGPYDRVTEPAVLRAALDEAVRTLAAAGRCP